MISFKNIATETTEKNEFISKISVNSVADRLVLAAEDGGWSN